MKKNFFAVFFLLILYSGGANATSIKNPCPEKDFPTVYKVFESVYICVGKRINTSTIQHAVNVTAEWLDNDNNGIADDIPVINALQQQTAILVLTQNGLGFFASRRLNHYYQDLYAHETNPKNQRDASQEEIHHLIVNLGWGVAYPDIFSDYSNSKMFQIYNTAEQKGYYHYDDPTCNRACKSVEFHYLGTASYLGAKADVAHDEIRLKTRTALMQKLPEFIRVIESPKYNYPKYKWPTGIYTHTQNIVKLRG